MVAVSEAVVDEWTVVVEVFDAAAAEHAVERRLGFDYFVVGAQIYQVKIVVQELFGEADEVEFFRYVTGVDCCADYVGWDQQTKCCH